MDLSPPLLSLCVMVTCLIGAARCSNPDKSNCCPEIAPFPLTEPPPGNSCYKIAEYFRYTCIDGYVRKVGTSNRIICKQNNSGLFWTKPSLQCIPDPNITTPPKTKTTVGETRTKATDWTTSASNTTTPSNNWTQGTVESGKSTELASTTTVWITCASLVVVSALIGIIFFLCYKRRSKHKVPPPTPEEQVPMNEVQPALYNLFPTTCSNGALLELKE